MSPFENAVQQEDPRGPGARHEAPPSDHGARAATRSLFADRHVQVGAIRARYRDSGTDGAPVVFIHGFAASVEVWGPVLAAVAPRHRVVAVDLPGFGLTDKPDAAYTLQSQADFIARFLDAIDVPRVSVVGHSYGGAVALRFTLDAPERVERLGLIAPAGLSRHMLPALRWMIVPGVGELLSRPSRAGSRMLIEAVTYDQTKVSDELIEATYQMSRQPGAQRGLLRCLRDAGDLFGQRRAFVEPILDGLPTLTMPALVIWGREDRILPEATAAAAALPQARVELWDGCGHIPWLEEPERFIATIRAFLS